jgi:hypothetical protein
VSQENSQQPECLYGEQTARRRLVLFGDSHAAQWFEAISAAAAATDWRLNNWTKSACPVADILVLSGDGRPNQACKAWRDNVMKSLTGSDRPDLVIIASRSNHARLADPVTGRLLREAETDDAWKVGYHKIIEDLLQAGIPTVFIRDTPTFNNFPACFVQGRSCDRRKAEVLSASRLELEVGKSFGDNIIVVDFNVHLCGDATCSPIKDGEVIFRDSHHLTVAFTRTLTPYFVNLLRKAAPFEGEQPQPVSAGPVSRSPIQ